MNLLRVAFACAAAGLIIAACAIPPASPDKAAVAPASPEVAANQLRPLSSFEVITNKQQRSLALFQEAGKVIQHPRCVNCHPVGESPLQTDAMRPHRPMVVRGAGGLGAPTLQCTTCHHDANFDAAGVPGDPNWHLAPVEMAWEGKTLGEICEQIKDPARNGGKTMEELLQHMEADTLVGWGWNPGGRRTPVPGTQAQFGEILRAWAASGAHCPKA